MFFKREPEVLVVGAGPVGMVAALMLRERGIRVEIIDQEVGSGRRSDALVLQGSCLELLDDLGIADRIVARGAPVDRLVVRDRAGGRSERPIAAAGASFPYLLVLPRTALEDVLETRLAEQKIPVHWSQRLASLEDLPDGVATTIETLGVESGGYPIGGHVFSVDKTARAHARFVIGADGHGSLVRRGMEIATAPVGKRESFLVVELATDAGLGREAHVAADGDRVSILWPLPGPRCRWTFQIDDGAMTKGAEPPMTRQQIEEIVAERAPWFQRAPADVEWAAIHQFEPVVAERFGRGHAWLAGEAAHVSGALGIPGLNEGLHEAHDLASRIARILRGVGGDDLLARYDEVRTAAWRPTAPPALIPYLTGQR